MSILYDEAHHRLQELRRIKEKIETKKIKYPPGKICVANRGDHVQFYLRENSKEKLGKYLKKENLALIRKLLQKDYQEKYILLVEKEIHSIEQFLKQSGDIAEQIQQLYSSKHEEVKKLIVPYDCSFEDYAKKWEQVEYERKEIYDTQTHFKTDRGEIVRSKSERHIANSLYKMGIPYRYEYPVRLLDGTVVHPDFMVLTRQRKEIYWEHRGIMDDRGYARDSVSRIKELGKIGIVIEDNLIITEETATSPLNTEEVERIINWLRR